MARIMIVDDSPSVRFLISTLVSQVGHEVVEETDNGRDALNAYFKLNPDLLIVDYQMPVFDGITVIEEIMKILPDAKILLCTGSIETLQSDLRMNWNVPIIAKPFDNDVLLESISTALTTSIVRDC